VLLAYACARLLKQAARGVGVVPCKGSTHPSAISEVIVMTMELCAVCGGEGWHGYGLIKGSLVVLCSRCRESLIRLGINLSEVSEVSVNDRGSMTRVSVG
jgi:hypothetical protein